MELLQQKLLKKSKKKGTQALPDTPVLDKKKPKIDLKPKELATKKVSEKGKKGTVKNELANERKKLIDSMLNSVSKIDKESSDEETEKEDLIKSLMQGKSAMEKTKNQISKSPKTKQAKKNVKPAVKTEKVNIISDIVVNGSHLKKAKLNRSRSSSSSESDLEPKKNNVKKINDSSDSSEDKKVKKPIKKDELVKFYT